jgi:PAS domain S-box-containing protein
VFRSRSKPAEDRNRSLLELLYHVSREVATALDLRTVLQRVLFETMRNVGGERASIVALDDSGKPVDATIVYGQQFHEHTTQQLRDTVERGLAGWVVTHRKGALVTDTMKDDRWLKRPDDAVEKTGSKSAICVPLLAREKMVGVLTLVHSVPNAFNEDHLELMQAIADQAGVAVLNARLYTESQRQARVMTALAEGAAAINTSLRMEEVLQRILNQTIQALQVETAAVAMMDASGGELVFRAATGQNAGNILGRRVPAGAGLVGLVAREGRGIVIPVVSADKRFTDADRFGGIRTKAVAAAPIQTQAGVIGVLEAINPFSGSFDPDALVVMNGLGSLAGTTIQNAQFYEQLNAAHARYRELFEDSLDAIFITDWNGHILESNRPAGAMSGYSDNELRSMVIADLHDIKWSLIGENYKLIYEGDGCGYESNLKQKQGMTTPVEVYVRRVSFEEADSIQWLLRDITERKELDALREDLTSMIYHDLRSPLANIVSSLEVLGGLIDPQDESAHTILGIASNSTARIQRLVDSLLDLNRLEAGQPIVDQSLADPAALIHQALKDVSIAAEGRRQKLNANLPDHLPLLWVDAGMAHRVLVNLLENASKFTPTEGFIEVGAQSDGEWLEFWVRDNGSGIPAEEQERIFEKFMRLRGREKPSGLGVGLAFCRLAVQGHGGHIWVESQNGNGATFHFTLPLATPQQLVTQEST